MDNYSVNRVAVDFKTKEPLTPTQYEQLAAQVGDYLRVVAVSELDGVELLPDQDIKEELQENGHQHHSSRFASCPVCMQHADDRVNGDVE